MSTALFISGSPRAGNTEYVLKQVARNIKGKANLILLREKNIGHCIGCMSCHDHSYCVIDDDMNGILEQIKNSELYLCLSFMYDFYQRFTEAFWRI